MSRILAIDFGERRIGLAVSDPLGITAQGLPTIDTRKSRDVFAEILSIIKIKQVARIVVGMPMNMDGSMGAKGKEVSKFIRELTRRTGMDVETWDERLTTVQSLRSMREMGVKQKKKGIADRISATLILESYLDRHNQKQNDSATDEI
jgi:putative Holliday junction resolvase